MENNNDKKLLLAVAFDSNKNVYSVDIAAGSNVNETAFAVSVIVKCLVRDKIIEKPSDFTDLVNKYISDPQYSEV